MSVNEKRHGFPRVKVGVSSCMLGQEVRFNGGHKRDGFLTGPLAGFVEFVPLCPEVGIGMGVPRPPIRLVGEPELLATIDAYRRGELPLVVPITLLRHYLRRHPDPHVERQHYLHPHPDELSLRDVI